MDIGGSLMLDEEVQTVFRERQCELIAAAIEAQSTGSRLTAAGFANRMLTVHKEEEQADETEAGLDAVLV